MPKSLAYPTLRHLRLLTMALGAGVFLTCALSAATCWSRASGNWDSDIWSTIPGSSPQPGLRPQNDDRVSLGLTQGVITISTPICVYEYSQRANDARTFIVDGAQVEWFRFFGQRGRNAQMGYTGRIEMNGGTLHVKERFILAGFAPEDIGVGTFVQNGGTVTLDGGLFLTQNAANGSPLASGIYTLNGGLLNIPTATPGSSGIRSGIGKAKFEWLGGTLNCRAVYGNLHNAGTGNFSPSGDGVVGLSILYSQQPKIYRQGTGARMTIDIASDKEYDRIFWQAGEASEFTLRKGTHINVQLSNGYMPKPGQAFDIIVSDVLNLEGDIVLGGASGPLFSMERVEFGKDRILRLVYRGKAP